MAQVLLRGGGVALVDEIDLPLVIGCLWRPWRPAGRETIYAVSGGGNTKVLMHRLVVHAPPGVSVDHRNQDGLDNRRHNLRFGTESQHRANSKLRSDNTSGFRGVTLHGSGLWLVRCGNRYVGYALTPEEGGHMYDTAAVETFGDFAVLNFPEETP